MPTIEHHTVAFSATSSGVINTAIAYTFEIPPHLVGLVFIGALVGLGLLPAIKLPADTGGKLLAILKTCGWLVSVTMLGSWLVPIVLQASPIGQIPAAAFTGLVIMVNRDRIKNILRAYVSGKTGVE